MNYYKVSTAVLTVMVISLSTILLIEWRKNSEAELSTCFVNQITKNTVSGNRLLDPDQGGWITPSTAGAALDKFKRRRGIFYNVKKRAYGHYFGLEKVREFIAKIDKYNLSLDSTDLNRIAGFRVYRSRNEYTFKGEKYDDVFFMPARLNKKNFYDIDPDYPNFFNPDLFPDSVYSQSTYSFVTLDTTNMILNTSAPCPNNCAPSL